MGENHTPTAAKQYGGNEQCEYDCENDAEWVVEINRQVTLLCCDNCGTANRLHPRDVQGQPFTVTNNK